MNWNYAYTPQIWPSLFSFAFLLGLSIYSWRRRSMPGARPFIIACGFTILWALGAALQSAALDPGTKFFWARFQGVWQLPSATAILCFILEYSWPGRWLTFRNLVLLSILPVVAFIQIVMGEPYDLISNEFTYSGGAFQVTFSSGYWIILAYVYLLTLVNFIVFIWLALQSPQQRWPVALMAIGQIIGRLSLLQAAGVGNFFPSLGWAPAFIFPFGMYAVALFGFKIFDPLPAAHQTVIQQMRTGMLVLNANGQVANLNPAAERMLGLTAKQARGQMADELLPGYPQSNQNLPEGGKYELCLGSGPDQRDYEAGVSRLKDWRGKDVGHLVLLEDVTAQKRAQAQLIEQQRALATLTEGERLGRELHDNLGQVLGYAGFQVEAAAKLSQGGQGAAAAAQLERLGGVIREAHADVREYILNLRTAPSPEQPLFPALQHYLHGYTGNYDIQTHLVIAPGLDELDIPAEAQLQITRILQEALSNPRKHGHAQHVHVTFTTEDERTRMIVQDDGIGFIPGKSAPAGDQHFGLQFMQERAAQVDGCLKVESAPGTGTRVILDIPRKDCIKDARAAVR